MLTTLERLKARRKEARGDEGFTLIELLIVIIILAILATIVIFAVGTTTKNAALAACQSTVKTTQTALEAFKAQTATGAYPSSITRLTASTTTKGPWLKQAPHSTATVTATTGVTITSLAKKYGWVLTGYTTTSGTFTVVTKGTATGKSTSTPKVCTGA